MAQMVLATQSNRSRAPQLSNETLLNYMVERQIAGAKSQTPLFGCPGIAAFTTAGYQPCRGLWEWKGIAYGVFGDGLYRIDDTGLAVLVGSGIGGTAPVGMSDNDRQICIVNGLHGWTFDATAGLELITDTGFYPARTVTFFDGYFIFDRRGTNQFFWSNLYDGRSYTGTSFATAESAPGEVVAVVQYLQLLMIFCTTHVELWYNQGTAGAVPFGRYTSSVPFGTHSPFAIVEQDGAEWFLGQDGVYYRMQGNQPVRVSTHAIETLIAAETDLARAEAFTFTVEGHKLIFLTLPSTHTTICFDISTGLWHDRDSVDANFNALGRYRGRCALRHNDSVLIGDAFDGRVGKVQFDTFTEYDLPMRALIDTVNVDSDRLNLFCSRLELDMQMGVGLASGQGSNPQILMRKSVDGGMTYGLAQPPRSFGRRGKYKKRVYWKRQGSGRAFAFQFIVTDPTPRTIIEFIGDFQQGVA